MKTKQAGGVLPSACRQADRRFRFAGDPRGRGDYFNKQLFGSSLPSCLRPQPREANHG
jgi:hypothetical protein